MKILSIDWDYFQDVKTETLRECYPEGIDNPTVITETIWRGKYALYGDRLSKVDLLQAEFQSLLHLLSEQRNTCPVMIANSHRHIYDFVHSHLSDKVQITNIDMHHDIINDNETLDCGNWIRELLKDGVVARSTLDSNYSSVLWIANPTSLDMYGLSRDYDASLQKMLRCLCRKKSISELFGEQYDLIYLARSDTWSPPHLDLYFCQLAEYIKSRFVNLSIEKGLDCSRTYLH